MIIKDYRVPDMHCPSCKMRLEGLEDDLPGIVKISASYQKQLLHVEFDEKSLKEEQLIQAVKDLGYQIELIQ